MAISALNIKEKRVCKIFLRGSKASPNYLASGEQKIYQIKKHPLRFFKKS